MAATLLLVDDDEVLSQVLRRVLTRAGYTVREANSVAQALQSVSEQRPDLALLDLRLPDGDGIDLARRIQEQVGPLPLILMTAYPLRLRDQPELARDFRHVLTKPLNLDELRQVIERVLSGATATATTPLPPTRALAAMPVPAPGAAAARPGTSWLRWAVWIGVCLIAIAGLAALPALGVVDLEHLLPDKGTPAPQPSLDQAGRRLTAQDDEIELAKATAEEMGIRSEKVSDRVPPRVLHLPGSLTFNPSRLTSVKSLFAGKVLSVGTIPEPTDSPSSTPRKRPLRYGDPVKEDQLLAVVLSSSLGEKKNDLINALLKQHLEEVTLESYRRLEREGNLPLSQVRKQEQVVGEARSEVERAQFALMTWGVKKHDIDEVEKEADQIVRRKGRRNLAKETEWAKVEIRAPFDGVIVEMTVPLGNYVDTTWDLFKVANLRQLGVMVHAYEEDLPVLRSLPNGYPWTIRTPAADPRGQMMSKELGEARVLTSAGIQQFGVIVDPTQHTAPVLGLVDNSDSKLTVGQFVTASIDLPAPAHVLALPIAAISTTGSDNTVFLQPDPAQHRYVRRRVAVTARQQHIAYVSTELTPQQRRQGLQVVRPKEWVVVAGVVELEAALDDLQARAKAHK